MGFKYAWKRGFRSPRGVDPQRVGEQIDKLHDAHDDGAQAEDLVEDARDPDSPLHPCFEWDDTVAADEHRKWQARVLLRVVVIVAPQKEMDPTPQSTFIRDPAGGAYRRTIEAMKVPALQERMLKQAREELEAFKRKYAHLQVLASVIDMVDDILEDWNDLGPGSPPHTEDQPHV